MKIEIKLTLDEVLVACKDYLIEIERLVNEDKVTVKDFGESGLTLLAEPKDDL